MGLTQVKDKQYKMTAKVDMLQKAMCVCVCVCVCVCMCVYVCVYVCVPH